jgi:hypothetical protein
MKAIAPAKPALEPYGFDERAVDVCQSLGTCLASSYFCAGK